MRIGIFVFIVIFCSSCCSEFYPPEVEEALKLAGENRSELEYVLNYYADSEDSLKLRAAEYLISNMRDKYSEYYNCYWTELYARKFRDEYISDTLNSERMKCISKIIKWDLECISSEFLINNIDLSFKVWREQPWGNKITFEAFCEEILPYRIDHEPLEENWREIILLTFSDYIDYFKNNPTISLKDAVSQINKQLPKFEWISTGLPDRSYTQLLSTPKGGCNDMCNLTIFVMRALGIPVTKDFIIKWPNQRGGHAWNAVHVEDGSYISFMGTESNPGESHLGIKLSKSKVYRQTFKMQDKDSLLTLENCIDVSHYYKNCSFSHQIKLFSDVNYDEDIFLMSFGKNVSSVQGKGVRCGNDVIFNDIGSSILYLPVIYRKRSYVPIGHPFMIEDDGMVVTYDGGESHELRMAEAGLNQKWLYRMQTGYFEGSNYCDFREGEILYKIEDRPLPQYNTIKLNQVEKYRFLRYVSPPKGNGNIAELEFYYEKQKISGTPIGIEGSWYDNGMTKDKVFDGDIDTYFDAPQGNGDYAWVGLDLTDQCYIDEIRFVPRLTNNNLDDSDLYEIFYWDKDDWISLKPKDKRDGCLYFEAPIKSILFLRNCTQDYESDRFFINDEGLPRWL